LDGNFPKPIFDVHALDNNVRYEHLADWRREFVEVSTPDWLIHLAAHEAGFAGVVTRDYHQVSLDEEAVALDRTRLSVITWRRGIDNAIILWGSLRAPQVGPSAEINFNQPQGGR